jgi:CheY-like chemotaxis protein
VGDEVEDRMKDEGAAAALRRPVERARRETPAEVAPALRGTETVLVVEDMAALRKAVEQMLCAAGYTVLCAASGEEALELFEQRGEVVQLVLTDVVMPKMNGEVLVERLRRARPELKVLFMSGYTNDTLVRRGSLEEGVHCLAKPFGPDELLEQVRLALAATGGEGEGSDHGEAR